MTKGQCTKSDYVLTCVTPDFCTMTLLISTIVVLVVYFLVWLILTDIQIIGHLHCFHVLPSVLYLSTFISQRGYNLQSLLSYQFYLYNQASGSILIKFSIYLRISNGTSDKVQVTRNYMHIIWTILVVKPTHLVDVQIFIIQGYKVTVMFSWAFTKL